MAELVKLKDICIAGEHRQTVTMTVEFSTTSPFWDYQLDCDQGPLMVKRALQSALEHDAKFGPYVMLHPHHGILDIGRLCAVNERFRLMGLEAMMEGPPVSAEMMVDNWTFATETGIEPSFTEQENGANPIEKADD